MPTARARFWEIALPVIVIIIFLFFRTDFVRMVRKMGPSR
jgi:hypothetical protein